MALQYSYSITMNKTLTQVAKEHLEGITEDLVSSVPSPQQLSAEGRRAIIARYSAVAEGFCLLNGRLLALGLKA